MPAQAQDPTGCSFATGSPGQYADTICWIDFASYDEALVRSDDGQPFLLDLPGGYQASFDFKERSYDDRPLTPTIPHSTVEMEAHGAFSNHFYQSTGGKPVLWNIGDFPTPVASSVVWTLDNIVVTGPDGNPVSDYKFVSGDAESTHPGEYITFQSDKNLELLEELRTQANNVSQGALAENASGLGTTQVQYEGTTTGDPAGVPTDYSSSNLLLASESPTYITQVIDSSSRNAGVFGFMMSKVKLNKVVESRFHPDDSFDLTVMNGSSEVSSVSTGDLDEATTGELTVLASSAITLSEAAGPGTSLDNYYQDWSCSVNSVDAPGITPASGATTLVLAADNPALAVGDFVECTITNTGMEPPALQIEKNEEATELTVNDGTVTYTVTATNTGEVAYTEENPAVVFDDMTDVLDDADFDFAGVTASQPGELGYEEPLLSWVGALEPGESVELSYTVTIKPDVDGDGILENIAWVPEDPEDPLPPAVCEEGDLTCATTYVEIPPFIGEAFMCSANEPAFLFQHKPVEMLSVNLLTGETISTTPIYHENINGVGYNTLDNYIYGAVQNTTNPADLMRVAADGTVTKVGEVPGMSNLIGDVDSDGFMWFSSHLGAWNKVDLRPGSTEFGETVESGTIAPMPSIYDWAWVPGHDNGFFGVDSNGFMHFFNKDTKSMSNLGRVQGIPNWSYANAQLFGAAYADAEGNFYVSDNGSGKIYKINTATLTAEVLATGGVSAANDGARCALSSLLAPTLTVSKTASEEAFAGPGDTLTYTVTVTNPGPGVFTTDAPATMSDDLSDVLASADLVGEPQTNVGTVTVDTENEALNWTGVLGVGESATITYEVQYTATYENEQDTLLENTACVPEDLVAQGAEACASVETPGPKLSQWKTVESDDDPVVAGSEVRYTLHFENSGEAPATVNAVDHFGSVLDDASIAIEAAASPLTVDTEGTTLLITGTLAPGETATYTYVVTPHADGARTDSTLSNFLTPEGEVPPEDGVCVPTNEERPDCTTTPVAASMLIEKRGQGPAGELPLAGAEFEITPPAGDAIAVTDESTVGVFLVTGLNTGAHTLTETKAPEGYTLLADSIEFEVLPTGAISTTTTDSTRVEDDGNGTWRLIITDVEAFVLPLSGGAGNMPWILGGMLLAGLAFITPVVRARREQTPSAVLA